ncbi:DUF4440 domain-containing protein [Nocardioides flavescens]|uniref:DUF4440 domain-containing protein n=1 Tax=Nocardioides flavescens TaxID=2691959 RepID=A0A6L7EXC2_9ACTN|nr:DUF4440 domain-containing protein [Nocardioides flavescens]
MAPADDVEEVLRLERELQSRACRTDPVRADELLADDFLEVGASGRRWDRASALGLLREEAAAHDAGEIEVLDLEGRAIAPGVVLVSWDSHRAGRRARRTSLWCWRDGRWQQVHHQGTLLP